MHVGLAEVRDVVEGHVVELGVVGVPHELRPLRPLIGDLHRRKTGQRLMRACATSIQVAARSARRAARGGALRASAERSRASKWTARGLRCERYCAVTPVPHPASRILMAFDSGAEPKMLECACVYAQRWLYPTVAPSKTASGGYGYAS